MQQATVMIRQELRSHVIFDCVMWFVVLPALALDMNTHSALGILYGATVLTIAAWHTRLLWFRYVLADLYVIRMPASLEYVSVVMGFIIVAHACTTGTAACGSCDHCRTW